MPAELVAATTGEELPADDDAYLAHIEAHIDAVVAAAPPLSDEQIAKLRILLAPDP